MWNEMGNNSTSLKEGNGTAEALEKSLADDTQEKAEVVLHLAKEEENTEGAQEKSAHDVVGRDNVQQKSQSISADVTADFPQVAEELALISNSKTGSRDDGVNTEISEKASSEQADMTLEVGEKPNQQKYEDGGNGNICPSVCKNLEDTALSIETNAEKNTSDSPSEEEGRGKSIESLLNQIVSPVSFGDIGELIGSADSRAGWTGDNNLALMDLKDNIYIPTLPSSANENNPPAETDAALIEESINTVQEMLEADVNLREETDEIAAEIPSQADDGFSFEQSEAKIDHGMVDKISEMGETGDPVGSDEGTEIKGNLQSYSSSSLLDPEIAIPDLDQTLHLQPDDRKVEDESMVFVKQTDLTRNPFTTINEETGRDFEREVNRFPIEDTPATDLGNTDACSKMEGGIGFQVDKKKFMVAVSKSPSEDIPSLDLGNTDACSKMEGGIGFQVDKKKLMVEVSKSPSEDIPALDLGNTDACRKIEGDTECQVDEEKEFKAAAKPPEIGSVEEGIRNSSEECFTGLPKHTLIPAETKEVINGIHEAEKPTEDTISEVNCDSQVSDENVQSFDPLKLKLAALTPPPINEEDSEVGCNSGLSREEHRILDSQNHGSKPDKVIHLHMQKSPSFDFDLRVTRTEESDRTPLLFQDKGMIRATTTRVEYGNAELKKLAKEKIVSFDITDLRTPSVGFSRDEEEEEGFHSNGIPEKEDYDKKPEKEMAKVLLLAPAKELKVGPNSPQGKGKRKPRSFIFGNCMCCATVIN